MEWVETIGKTVEEAKGKALDELGVTEDDAEFEILDEPKPGLFGRIRGEARVRARVRPAQARQKVDRRDRRRAEKSEKGDSAEVGEKQDKPARAPRSAAGETASRPRQARAPKSAASSTDRAERSSSIEHKEREHPVDAHQVGEEARRFVTGLLEAFGLEGEVDLTEEGDDLELNVRGQELGLLVGPRGVTLQAVQDLARVASQRRLGDHDTRLRLDVGGYRERRREALGRFADQMAEEVKASGVARVLEPMSSADRKIIHDSLSSVEGIATRSEGEDPYRRVVISPAND
jgi:spoIIIJ-associated protein